MMQGAFAHDPPCPRHEHFLQDQKSDLHINNQNLTSIWFAPIWLRNFFKKDNEENAEKKTVGGIKGPGKK
jgi:hypothetical protein